MINSVLVTFFNLFSYHFVVDIDRECIFNLKCINNNDFVVVPKSDWKKDSRTEFIILLAFLAMQPCHRPACYIAIFLRGGPKIRLYQSFSKESFNLKVFVIPKNTPSRRLKFRRQRRRRQSRNDV